jgi:hypothetical protein
LIAASPAREDRGRTAIRDDLPIPVHVRRYILYGYRNEKGLCNGRQLFDLDNLLHCPTPLHLIEGDRKAIRRYVDFAEYGRSIPLIGLPPSDTTEMHSDKWSRLLADCHAGH